MQISDKRFTEFKELMRNKVGEEEYSKMTEQKLLASAITLVTMMKAIYKPITKADYEKYRVLGEEKQKALFETKL